VCLGTVFGLVTIPISAGLDPRCITEENIGESANFRGTLDDETLELEVGLEEGRQTREQQLEERSAQDSDVGARALASGMTQAEINALER